MRPHKPQFANLEELLKAWAAYARQANRVPTGGFARRSGVFAECEEVSRGTHKVEAAKKVMAAVRGKLRARLLFVRRTIEDIEEADTPDLVALRALRDERERLREKLAKEPSTIGTLDFASFQKGQGGGKAQHWPAEEAVQAVLWHMPAHLREPIELTYCFDWRTQLMHATSLGVALRTFEYRLRHARLIIKEAPSVAKYLT